MDSQRPNLLEERCDATVAAGAEAKPAQAWPPAPLLAGGGRLEQGHAGGDDPVRFDAVALQSSAGRLRRRERLLLGCLRRR